MTLRENDSHFGSARVTGRRRAIARAVDSLPGAFIVEDLVSAVRSTAPGTGTATIYRAVTAMEEAGALERVGTRDGSTLYVRCRAEHHHHHLICTQCGAVAAAECPFGHDISQPSTDGFVVTGHEITLYGLCGTCSGAPISDDHSSTTPTRKD